MKKLLLLISLSLFLGIPVRAEEDIQALCKEQIEKADEAIKVISTIHDKSIKDFLYQNEITPMLENITKQSSSKEIDGFLPFKIYYNSGVSIAFQKIDERVQAYKNEYDNLPGWKKSETVNPYEPLMVKKEDGWHYNPKNRISFYFSLPDNKPNPKYIIKNLHNYLQEYVDCSNVTKEGETITRTDRNVKFMNDNKLWTYEPQELADLIIQVYIELNQAKYIPTDYEYPQDPFSHFVYLWACNCNLFNGLHKNITLQEATEEIKAVVYALSPLKYNDVMEALNNEFEQKGMSDTQANKEAEKKLDNIIKIYANKLVEKARGGQSVQKKN